MSRLPADFYRTEAVQENQSHFGSVLIHQPLAFPILAVVVGAVVLLALSFAYFGTYTRKATVSGLLVPEQGLLRLTVMEPGIIKRINFAEGAYVKAGQDLLVLSSDRVSGSGRSHTMLMAQQFKQRLGLLAERRRLMEAKLAEDRRMIAGRLRAIEDELVHFDAEIALLRQRLKLAQANLQRNRDLVQAGFISVAQLQEHEVAVLTIQGQIQSIGRSRSNLNQEKVELLAQEKDADFRHRIELAGMENTEALIHQEQLESDLQSERIVTAPFAGVVSGLNVQAGQHVVQGTVLASLAPEVSTLQAHLYVPSDRIGFLLSGQRVLLRYAAFPYQKFGMGRGVVREVIRTPYAAQELPAHVTNLLQGRDLGRLYYRVTVEIDSQEIEVYGVPQKLQAGMLVEADVIQDSRRIYEWALEPIYSITGKMS